jgi:hypothetical protein
LAGQLVTFGLLAEMLTYFFHRDRNDYSVLAVHDYEPKSGDQPLGETP